jgi:hypothetical protein
MFHLFRLKTKELPILIVLYQLLRLYNIELWINFLLHNDDIVKSL